MTPLSFSPSAAQRLARLLAALMLGGLTVCAPSTVLAQASPMLSLESGLFGATPPAAGTVGLPAPRTLATPEPRLQTLPQAQAPNAVPETQAAVAPRKLPPLATTEFQRFVAESSGQRLPIFGASLFDDTQPGYTPLAGVPVPANYVIGPGDEVLVRTTGVLDFELRLTVDRNGQIVLPKVGPVQLAGVRVAELESHLTREVSRSFRNFTLSATLGQLRSIDVYVVGQARQPGKFTVSSLASLVNAVFLSGGPAAHGSMRQIRLMRDGQRIAQLDLYRFILDGDRSADPRLLPGDVIVFPPAGPRVALLGAAATPAIYELTATEATVGQLIAWSGGLPVLTAPQRALLERIEPGEPVPRRVEEFALDAEGLKRPLRDGDVLTLLPISPEFANAVTLRGNVAQPLRYPHRPGMRISDLIPGPEALITPDYFRRKNILVQPVGRERESSLDLPREDTRLAQGETARVAGRPSLDLPREDTRPASSVTRDAKVTAETVRNDVRNLLDEVNWDYAVVERLDRKELVPQLIPFNLGKAVLQRDPSHDLELQPGDVVSILGKRDLTVPVGRQTRLVRIEGEVAAPGIYQTLPGETLVGLLARAGGTTREAYVYGTQFSREGVRRQQRESLEQVVRRLEEQLTAGVAARQANVTSTDTALQQQQLLVEERLARERLQRLRNLQPNGRIALELDPAAPVLPPIALEDGDRIVVPARPSFVQAVGAVYNDNALVWREGRRVREYLKSAGVTESADVDATFVLRADGSIAAREAGGGLFSWGNPVLDLVLQPGDTIVVPEKIDRETRYTAFMRGLKDWTQVIYQLGLGAAAIKVLR